MRYQQFELAISRYTFVDDVMQPPVIERGLTALNLSELKEQLSTFRLCFIQPALFKDKAVAIGSPNVVSPLVSELSATRTHYAMVICRIDGEAPTPEHISALTSALNLEPRQRFMSPDSDGPSRGQQPPQRFSAA